MDAVNLAEIEQVLSPQVWYSQVVPKFVGGAALDWSGVDFSEVAPEEFSALLAPFKNMGLDADELRIRVGLVSMPPGWRALAEGVLELPAEGVSPLLSRDAFARIQHVREVYRGYVEAFVKPENPAIRTYLEEAVEKGGLLWREPYVELRRELKSGPPLERLVNEDLLHPDALRIFRQNAHDAGSPPIRPYVHQVEAFRRAKAGENVVVATGTGSGKSFAFGLPVIDYALRMRDEGKRGTKAILVYPMNALANDQFRDLVLRLRDSGLSVALYTGETPHTREEGEDRRRSLERELRLDDGALSTVMRASREEIRQDPPDILLTNYVMLELILTRREDLSLFPAEHRGLLRYLVLDELHTYGGLKGADTALLIRRLKVHTGTEGTLRFIGTSATIEEEEGDGALDFASRLFGAPVEVLIRETYADARPTPAVPQPPLGPVPELKAVGKSAVEQLSLAFLGTSETDPGELGRHLQDHPTLGWIGAQLSRGAKPLAELVSAYAEVRNLPPEEARRELLAFMSLAQFAEVGEKPLLQLKLHGFYSQNVGLTGTLHDPPRLSGQGELELGGSPAYPVVFCRQCKNEFYVAFRGGNRFQPAEFGETEGVVYLTPGAFDPEEVSLPENWLTGNGGVKSSYRPHTPRNLRIDPERGEVRPEEGGRAFVEVAAPFLFCPHCGIHYDRRPAEYAKLTPFGLVGRSTATDLILLATLGSLAEDERKIIAFTDNVQDTSFQSAHFSDLAHRLAFRQALLRLLDEKGSLSLGEAGLEVLNYWKRSGAEIYQDPEVSRAYATVLQLFAAADAARNVQPNFPNLEEAGLVRYEYKGLEKLVEDENLWKGFEETPADVRADVLRGLLDLVRRREALGSGVDLDIMNFDFDYRVRQLLEDEGFAEAVFYEPGEPVVLVERKPARPPKRGRVVPLIGGVRPSRFEQWVIRALNLERREDAQSWLRNVYLKLQDERLLSPKSLPSRGRDQIGGHVLSPSRVRLQRVRSKNLRYCPKSRVPFYLKVLDRSPEFPGVLLREEPPSAFFRELYQEFWFAVPPQAGPHSAQVPAEDRRRLEASFRDPESPLAVLVATPTLELGVDIGALANVYLRNVPPSPANYAQRSGRAGRRGQPALVQVFAGQGYRRGPHDQYFYRHPEEMIRGEVRPPRFLLDNEKLTRAHLHAVVLEHLAPVWELPGSMQELVDVEARPAFPLRAEIEEGLKRALNAERTRILEAIARSLALELQEFDWLDLSFIEREVDGFVSALDRTLVNWRKALATLVEQHEAVKMRIAYLNDPRVRGGLQRELDALGKRIDQLRGVGDNPLRVRDLLESEGFVPNYAFSSQAVHLDLLAARGPQQLTRTPLIALREYAPGNFVYYGKSAYEVNRMAYGLHEDELVPVALCPNCGFPNHPEPTTGRLPQRCQRCGQDLSMAPRMHALPMPWQRARRRRRITSEEEERRRRGYLMVESYQPSGVVEGYEAGELRIEYDHQARIRVSNLGPRAEERGGFVLCRKCGEWLLGEKRIEQHPHREGKRGECPQFAGEEDLVHGVVLFHEAEVDALVLYAPKNLDDEQAYAYYQSLGWALWRAALVALELEEGELGVFLEPAGASGVPYRIVFHERVEGGLGALRSLLEPARWDQLIDVALDLLHANDPEEACEKACYRCLLSYHNQAVHHLLDRRLVLNDLKGWRRLVFSPAASRTRIERLLRHAESELEKKFLNELKRRSLPLPDEAQYTVAVGGSSVRYDFYYREADLGVFVDGPGHDDPKRLQGDALRRGLLTEAGRRHLVFRYDQDWTQDLETLRSLVSAGGRDPWGELLSVRPDLEPLVEALKARGVPPPDAVLEDLVGDDGAVAGQALLRWGRVVLVDMNPAKIGGSWKYVEVAEDPDRVVEAIKDAMEHRPES
ncbi:DEAD/DEAH box helicase [Oceanithermus desulfurans NBRC 100063]|uniref:DEAD/DEAH box helicase n=1 Tax=Oceanithermus desulfurans NBRC 100063 TaxID=1227550 RepID=A0A511RK58_9DEIN|nr:DEAD/DEAH box helicase [Oceanithermus desulfurans NBRC 100063]